MTTYTPGPWEIKQERDGMDRFIVHQKDNPFFTVAFVTGFSRHDAEANAHLVKAAPDLLAALRASLTALEEFREMFTERDCPGLPDLIEQTEAAIAKAEGRAS